MIRIELFILLGIAIGVALEFLRNKIWTRVVTHHRENAIKAAETQALKVRVDRASTDELLEELSQRNDLRSHQTWDRLP